MGSKAKFHGRPFDGLETTERLSDEEINARAQELLGQLTQDEKIKMMSGDLPFWLGMADMMGAAMLTIPGWPAQCRGWAFPACVLRMARAG